MAYQPNNYQPLTLSSGPVGQCSELAADNRLVASSSPPSPRWRAHNRLVGGSSPLSPTTQSRANRDFPVSYHKRKVLARQRNKNYGYGNVRGYAEETRSGPMGLFFNW